MFDEMSFLFGSSKQISNQFNTNKDSTRKDLGNVTEVSNTNNAVQSAYNRTEFDETDHKWKHYKYSMTDKSVKNYIKSDVNKSYLSSGKNPYLDLLDTFNGEDKSTRALKLQASDFSYLRDIGVYPINRLMILRRFPEGAVVPVDLNDLETYPTSTIIGWVKEDNDLLNFAAHEVWKESTTPLHELMRQIIQAEFGIDIGRIFPIPGWGIGFMFGLLKKMGLTDYSATDLPIGDPNLLRQGITRPHEEQGLMSNFTFTLETVYEQKFIGGIDAGAAFNDILKNNLNMSTSDIRFLGKAGNKISQAIRKANDDPSNPSGWKDLIISVVKSAVGALKSTFTRNATEQIDTNKSVEADAKKTKTFTDGTTKATDEDNTESEDKGAEGAQDNLNKIGLIERLISSVLESTVGRYQWPIRGALNQLTGEAGTPWHLTIGNPNSPLLSMNNVKLTGLDVTMGNELAYNDMSKFMTVKVSLEQGRNMGKQEIESMFNVKYKRRYKKVKR